MRYFTLSQRDLIKHFISNLRTYTGVWVFGVYVFFGFFLFLFFFFFFLGGCCFDLFALDYEVSSFEDLSF